MLDRKTLFTVIVAALGYFVDVYDLIVFSVVRVASLKDLGLTGQELTDTGVFLLNAQMAGMLLGGIFWGVLGDKKGRLSILFGSILLYSLCNIANAFVTTVDQYALCRFLAGIGLAGEIGAGITLVAELLPKEKRGLGTTIVATLGVAGGFTAALIGDFFPWKTAYLIGGCMGFALLALRVAAAESGMFQSISHDASVKRGDLRLLFGNGPILRKFIYCTMMGMPLWFIVGLIMTFAPEIGQELGLDAPVTTAGAILYFYGGLVAGDLLSGVFSQVLKSRKKVLYIFTAGAFLGTMTVLNLPSPSAHAFYVVSGITGFFAGYWAMFLTVSSESFGTNLRATVTTAVPNLVRGGAIILSSIFAAIKGTFGITLSLEIIACGVFGASLISIYMLKETFGTDLNYIEKKA